MPEKPHVLHSHVAYDGKIFQAVVERVRLPGRDRDSQVEIVRHAGSVAIAAMPSDDAVLLVRQYRHPAGGVLWELPAGSIDPGEDAETAARRECHEELGMIAGRAERLGEAWPLPGYCTEYMTFFRLTDLRSPGAGDAASAPGRGRGDRGAGIHAGTGSGDGPERRDQGPEDGSRAGAACSEG